MSATFEEFPIQIYVFPLSPQLAVLVHRLEDDPILELFFGPNIMFLRRRLVFLQ